MKYHNVELHNVCDLIEDDGGPGFGVLTKWQVSPAFEKKPEPPEKVTSYIEALKKPKVGISFAYYPPCLMRAVSRTAYSEVRESLSRESPKGGDENMKALLSLIALVVGLTFGSVTFVQADEKAAAPAAPAAAAPAAPAPSTPAAEEKKVDTKKAEKKEQKKKAEKK